MLETYSKIVILGSEGVLGSALIEALEDPSRQIIGTCRDPAKASDRSVYFDLHEPESFVCPESVDAVIFCSAMTQVAECERAHEASHRFNVTNTISVMREIIRRRIPIFFFSTNLVFDGLAPFRTEAEPPSPTTHYGRQKVEVENYLVEASSASIILRITKAVTRDTPLVKGWVEDLKEGRVIKPFSDMRVSPITLDYLCKAVAKLLLSRASGIFHISGEKDLSYAEFASLIAESLGVAPSLVQPQSTRDVDASLSHNILHTVLGADRLRQATGLAPQSVAEVVANLL